MIIEQYIFLLSVIKIYREPKKPKFDKILILYLGYNDMIKKPSHANVPLSSSEWCTLKIETTSKKSTRAQSVGVLLEAVYILKLKVLLPFFNIGKAVFGAKKEE